MFVTRSTRAARGGLPRFLVACLALALLAFGGGAHLLHHIEDPGCDDGRTPESHACAACSNLHGGATADDAPALVSAPASWRAARPDAVARPGAPAPAGDAAPRAPPLA